MWMQKIALCGLQLEIFGRKNLTVWDQLKKFLKLSSSSQLQDVCPSEQHKAEPFGPLLVVPDYCREDSSLLDAIVG